MQFLLDTTALSDLVRKHGNVLERIHQHGLDNFAVSTITRGEILFGIRRLSAGRRQDDLSREADRYFGFLQCEPVATETADRYAGLKADCERTGRIVAENDLWIAATALALGATLVTRDTDFDGIEGLLLENWSA